MPVSVITDVVTWMELIAQIGISTVEVGLLIYLLSGGWLDMIRTISFWLDTTIIKYVDQFYSYFGKLLDGKIFAPTVVDEVMTRVYAFVAVIVLFKVIMLFMKYLINPEMVQDEKVGTTALIKRVILGMVGMIMLPTIFTFSTDLQSAILNDNLLGKLLLDKGELRAYEKNKDQMGRVLAFNVFQAFWNANKSTLDKSQKKKYELAISTKDPGAIGGFLMFGGINSKNGDDYAYDYFPIASTVVLLYVLYLIIKYCIDVVVRMFKLFLLQMLGPLAISDYMINGDSKDVFKSWLKMCISVYLMLFVRIFSIWFIAFITILMGKECTAAIDGICSDSMLYIPQGQDPDYLLRGIITLGLLALLMDLPKFISDILGYDLEQDASVKGIMSKAGGMLKSAGMGALTVGGAAAGGALGAAKAVGGTAMNAKMFGKGNEAKSLKEKLADTKVGKAANSAMGGKFGELAKSAKANGLAEHKDKAFGGIMSAALQSNSVTGAAYKGYSSAKQEQDGIDSKNKQKADAAKQEAKEALQREEDINRNITERLIDSSPKDTPKEQIINGVLDLKHGNVPEMTAEVAANIKSQQNWGDTPTVQDVSQTVKMVADSSGLNVSLDTITQTVQRVADSGGDITSVDSIEQIVRQVRDSTVSSQEMESITQVVNQTYGTKVGNTADYATQQVNQTQGTKIDNSSETIHQNVEQEVTTTNTINNSITEQVEVSREMNDTVSQQFNISREYNDEVKVIQNTGIGGTNSNQNQ